MVDSACVAIVTRLANGLTPRGVRWWENGVCAYWCDFCDRAFSKSANLKTHMRVHTGIKPFKCLEEGCGYASADTGSLIKHMRTHTGIKPFRCTEDGCGFASATSSGFAVHTRRHNGIKPYKCTEAGCGFASSQSTQLVTHMRVHTGERPFKCAECDYACAHSSHLKSHLESVHDVGQYRCDYCLGNRNSRTRYYDEAAKANVSICRDCYRKATGFTSRVEKRWCEYTDEHLGIAGLMGSDDSLRSLGGCSMNRPDRLYGDHRTVELDECDEHQHTGSSYRCEQRRISDFYNEPSVCGKTMIVIRWNPDGYKPLPGRVKVPLKERMRLFVMLKKALREKRAGVLPKIVVFYMFYSRDNDSITADFPHYHVDSEADIRIALE